MSTAHADIGMRVDVPPAIPQGVYYPPRLSPARDLHVTVRDGVGDSCMDDANNALRVNLVAGAVAGGTSQADKSAFAEGAGILTPAGAMVNDVIAGPVAENTVGVLRITPARGLHATIRDVAGDSCMDEVNNALQVNVVAGGGAGGTSSAFGAVFPAAGTAAGFSDGANMQGARTFDEDTGVGTENVLGVSLRRAGIGGSVETGVLATPLRVDPTGTTTQPVGDAGASLTVDTPQLPAALVGGRLDVVAVAQPGVDVGDVTVNNAAGAAAVNVQDGGNVLSVDSAQLPAALVGGRLDVVAVAQPGVDIGDVTVNNAAGAGAVNIQDGGNAITVDGTVTANQGGAPWQSVGNVAHDAAVSGNPNQIAGEARDAKYAAALAAGDVCRINTDRYGRVQVTGPTGQLRASSNGAPVGAANTIAVAAPGANTHLRIRYIHASNAGATATVAGWRDGAAGALRYEAYLIQGSQFAHRIEGGWDLTSATAFYFNTVGAGSAYWTVEYEVVDD